MDEERPAFRYDARLAGEIERRWQERWEREGTFRAANPSGELADGALSAGSGPRPAQVLPAGFLSLPQRHRAARGASAGVYRH